MLHLPTRHFSQAIKSQDRALQHSEELRLALAAATREVADLQSQAALASAGLEGPAAAALQAASQDAQRWREAAEARLAAAQQAEGELRREAAQLQQRALASRTGTAQGLQQLLASYMQHRQRTEEEVGDGVGAAELPTAPAPAPVGLKPAAAAPAAVQPALPPAQFGGAGVVQQQAATPQHPPYAAERIFGSLAPATQPVTEPQVNQQPQPAAAAPAGSMPPSRTASDILAAYRARQQQRSSAGGGAIPAAAARSRSRSLSQEGSREAAAEASEGAAAGGGPAGPAGAAAAMSEPSTYSIDGFVTDESSKF